MKKAKKKNSILRIMLIVIAAIILAIALFIGIFFHWANNVELKMVHKTHFDFVVSPVRLLITELLSIHRNQNQHVR